MVEVDDGAGAGGFARQLDKGRDDPGDDMRVGDQRIIGYQEPDPKDMVLQAGAMPEMRATDCDAA